MASPLTALRRISAPIVETLIITNLACFRSLASEEWIASENALSPGTAAVKIFISWSGARSKAVAELLRDWIRCVLQSARPWVSTRDLDRGSLWFGEINEQLKDTTVGIICLTQENKERPWILFEAGALTKGLSSSRVCPLLIDLETKDVSDPLAQFNLTRPDRDGIYNLVVTLNGCAGTSALDSRILDMVFQTYWKQFEEGLRNVLETVPAAIEAKPRNDSDILSDILENTRNLSNRILRIEESTADRYRRKPRGNTKMFRVPETVIMIEGPAPLRHAFVDRLLVSLDFAGEFSTNESGDITEITIPKQLSNNEVRKIEDSGLASGVKIAIDEK